MIQCGKRRHAYAYGTNGPRDRGLENESGGTTEVALALLPDGVREGMVLIFENFEYRIKE